MPAPETRAAVFLDRDGVLNELVVRDGGRYSPRTLGEFRIYPDAAANVARLRATGLRVFVVTNQPDLARQRMARVEHERMISTLRVELAPDDVAFCPHDDADRCDCRKPLPGMLRDLAKKWNVDLSRSFMIGDGVRDVAAGRAAGCFTILIGEPSDDVAADATVRSLGEAVTVVEAQLTFAESNAR
jgi:D-glycero-D-manno-heptose 1,7-bisphosphate phosphatase